jgi:hypothetical protein
MGTKWGGAVAIALASLSASALDIKGFSTPGDAACAVDPACALPRGGVSDIMTVYDPEGSVVGQIFAFGNEEADNLYYFGSNIQVDAGQFGLYTTVLENTGEVSDTFGVADLAIADIQGLEGLALAFISDPNTFPDPIDGLTFSEILDPTPNPYVWEPGGNWSIEYDATRYLSPELRREGFTVGFRTDVEVPEPASLALLGIGAAAAGFRRQRKTA